MNEHEEVPKDKKEATVITGLSYSFSMTFLAEIGDKTFIMIMIFVPKMNNIILFVASSMSLAMMHTLGALFGGLFQLFIDQYILAIISCLAFFLFGVLLIYQGKTMQEETIEEKIKEVEKEMNQSMMSFEVEEEEGADKLVDGERQVRPHAHHKANCFMRNCGCFFGNSFVKVFFLVTLSEMGDRSQITAIALATTYPVALVIIGGIVGHMMAMVLAVLAGRFVAEKVSESTITICGGILFIIFSVYQLVFEILGAMDENQPVPVITSLLL